jgi:hypothetical protein
MTHRRLLLVEPDGWLRGRLHGIAATHAEIHADAAAPSARARLLSGAYDWLVTNIRLDAYNGLHLAYLAHLTARPMRIVVYGEACDLPLAREAQSLGAFFESRLRIAEALASYLSTDLPAGDRRVPTCSDRRLLFRGGRRAGDGVAWPAIDRLKLN